MKGTPWSSLCPWATAREAGKDRAGRAEALSRARGEACGPAWTPANPGRGRALAALPSPARRLVEMWGRLTKQVRPRPSPSAPAGARGRAELWLRGLRLAGKDGSGGRGAKSRGAAGGAEPAGARSSPACSARPCPPHGNFPAAELAVQNPETRSLGDYAILAPSCPTPLP